MILNLLPEISTALNFPVKVNLICRHDMARPRVPDGEDDPQIWRAAANILNKESLTADKG